MSGDVKIVIGDSLADMGQRFISAWKRAEAGDLRQETVLSFENWGAFVGLLTEERVELLRELGSRPATSVGALARRCHRDDGTVRADVSALLEAGLIEAGEAGLVLAFDSLAARLDLR